MDPGRAGYGAEMVAQTQRRVANIPHFQGVVVDRSDYARYARETLKNMRVLGNSW